MEEGVTLRGVASPTRSTIPKTASRATLTRRSLAPLDMDSKDNLPIRVFEYPDEVGFQPDLE